MLPFVQNLGPRVGEVRDKKRRLGWMMFRAILMEVVPESFRIDFALILLMEDILGPVDR